jgi:RNA polymerase sigma-70 factor (ECF subfamily)
MSTSDFHAQLQDAQHCLQRYALKLTNEPESARDLLQDTFYKALTNSGKFRPGTSIRAWLTVIMRNIYINNYRNRVIRSTYEKRLAEESATRRRCALTANNHIENTIARKEIESGIDKMPEKIKQTFRLYCQGLQYQEISDHLNEPLGTTKSRIFTGKALLRKELSIENTR